MALSADQITQAYKIVFGGTPAKSEIREIQATPQYWGKSLDSVVDKLMQSGRFANMPANDNTIKTIYRVYFGGNPTASELKEIKNTPGWWGSTAGAVRDRIQQTNRYIQDPGIKITKQIRNEDLNKDLKKMGLSQDVINGMSTDQKTLYGAVGKQMMDNIEKSIPAPTTWTAKTLKDLYKQAKDNPKIDEYYSRLEDRQINQITTSLATLQEDFEFLQTQQAEDFTGQVERLADETQQAGMLYSGIRKENQARLAEKQLGVIKSSRIDAQLRLDGLARSAEEALGTKAIEDLKLALRSKTQFGQFVDPKVAQRMGGDIGASASLGKISASESGLGQQRQAEVQAEYERLKSERDILTNSMNQS